MLCAAGVGVGMEQTLKDFYEREYEGDRYAASTTAEEHAFFPQLQAFVDEYHLESKRCLEIGCGRGAFQDAVTDYTGVDISLSVRRYLHKPFSQASATALPFPDCTFDAIWSYAVLEHVPNPELALVEIRRVLRNHGLLLLAPAWQCRPWAAEGYPVRPYSDFDLRGKLIKASIPLRGSVWFRAMDLLPRRALGLAKYMSSRQAVIFRYRELMPNYETYWMSDSDAVNSMDPFDAILWFLSRGDECVNFPTWTAGFKVRTGPLVFRVRKSVGRSLG